LSKKSQKKRRVPRAPFGYRVKDGGLVIDRETKYTDLYGKDFTEYEVARLLIDSYKDLKALSKACDAIAQAFRTSFFGPASLRRWLLSEVLIGHIVHYPKDPKRKQVIEGQHEAIMASDEQAAIRALLSHNKKIGGWGSRGHRYALAGLVQCSVCGKNCVIGNSSSTNTRYYHCHTRQAGGSCSNHKWVRKSQMEAAVNEAICAAYPERANLHSLSEDDRAIVYRSLIERVVIGPDGLGEVVLKS